MMSIYQALSKKENATAEEGTNILIRFTGWNLKRYST